MPVCVCACMCVHAHVSVCMHACVHSHACMCMHVCECMCACVRVHVCMCVNHITKRLFLSFQKCMAGTECSVECILYMCLSVIGAMGTQPCTQKGKKGLCSSQEEWERLGTLLLLYNVSPC